MTASGKWRRGRDCDSAFKPRGCACVDEKKRKGRPHTCVPEKSVAEKNTTDREIKTLAQKLSKMAAMVDSERTAPLWTTTTQDENGHFRSKLAQFGIVVTTPWRDELEWLDVAIRRSTSSELVHGAASAAGHVADKGKNTNDETRKQQSRIRSSQRSSRWEDGRRHRHGKLYPTS